MTPRDKIAALGAGRMGRGIAIAFAFAGHDVARIDFCVPSLWMSQRSKCSIGPAFITISGGWMIGPAFISAPDSASPQGSITPGNALPITASA